MVQISADTIQSMKNLNKARDWSVVREQWIIPMLKELNNIYDENLNIDCCENDFKAEYLAKIKAFGKLETIIAKIDYYADKDERKNLSESFE
jgi:hypothetical protein